MPIAVQCPSCRSRLGVADSAAGKKVKCPKCAKMLPVPGGEEFEVVEDEFEVVEDEFEVVDETPKPAKKLAARRNDEDAPKSRLAATRSPRSGARDDDDDDVPPRK